MYLLCATAKRPSAPPRSQPYETLKRRGRGNRQGPSTANPNCTGPKLSGRRDLQRFQISQAAIIACWAASFTHLRNFCFGVKNERQAVNVGCPLFPASSTDRCNTFCELLS